MKLSKFMGILKLGKNYSEQDLNKVLNDLYSTKFFKDVRVEIKNGNLKVNLVEYPVINTLILIGEKSNKYKEEIKKIISSKEKDSFIKSNISRDVELIKKLYSSAGYNFVKVETKIRDSASK